MTSVNAEIARSCSKEVDLAKQQNAYISLTNVKRYVVTTVGYCECHATLGCGHRFKLNVSQKSVASHCLVCPCRPGNFDPIAAEDGNNDQLRQMEGEMEKMTNFYDAFTSVEMSECRNREGRLVQRIDKGMVSSFHRQTERIARDMLFVEDKGILVLVTKAG